ncbi:MULTISPECIES: amino acid ABC transporter ATP-binding protein [Acetobacterium]|jgi:polar amino acid transport system ATP-binding protein|uniref:Amino acid ABC transporter ATP-binding protein n=1 Tax=Acetobacterium wieringae TaxID=52694 RepID=A0A5D0WJ49_9FIRM|nr:MULTISPECIES: amino acid ABC transporter ATP-binding protein [Acetobacterium]MEA4807534.1 amino acid ABC transporter ATP-binding protein [Acetobacterium wieringae]TYC84239.1 amino acid ABC transporter ATP-binding protein [Acetobacterium wieringae]
MNIELINICKTFQDELVLQDVCGSFDIHSIAVIGPSGGGKSTLLRIIGGLLAPDSGSLKIDGEIIGFSNKYLQSYRRNIGFVFQSKGLFEHLTALENIILPLVHTFGMGKSQALEISSKLFERFGLTDEKSKYPFQLSGGQQQRIAIARAVAVKPKLLLLDEPTSALDPEYTAEVLNMLGELQNEGLKTIIVTHEMGFAKNACEKVVFLANKQIIESGNSSRIFKNPQTEELQNFLNKILEWKV